LIDCLGDCLDDRAFRGNACFRASLRTSTSGLKLELWTSLLRKARRKTFWMLPRSEGVQAFDEAAIDGC